jgi:mannose-6-phosphate isomerase-like protein (cupin superfamily)
MHSHYKDIPAYITKDGSQIRELMHPDVHSNAQQSLAEARVPPGHRTVLHRHGRTEELYHITAGRGVMTLGEQTFPVQVGDTVCIPPGTPHCIENDGAQPLVILCCCAPPYSHDDTQLLQDD